MATNLISTGDNLTLAAPAAVSSGDLVIIGNIAGVASHDAESGADVTLATRGVYTLPKISTQVWTVGQLVYWDIGEDKASTTQGSGDILIGVAVAAAANPTATGEVRLNGSFN